MLIVHKPFIKFEAVNENIKTRLINYTVQRNKTEDIRLRTGETFTQIVGLKVVLK